MRSHISWIMAGCLTWTLGNVGAQPGSLWRELGGSASPDDLATGLGVRYEVLSPHAAIFDSEGHLVVALVVRDINGHQSVIRVFRREGDAWSELYSERGLRGIAPDGDNPLNPQMAIDDEGDVHIVWESRSHVSLSGVMEIHSRRWDGTSWQPTLDGEGMATNISNTPEVNSSAPRMAGSSTGQPHLVWVEGESVHVRQWDGQTWIESTPDSASGNGVSGTDVASQPRIAVLPSGIPIVGWQTETGPRFVMLDRERSVWEDLPVFPVGHPAPPEIVEFEIGANSDGLLHMGFISSIMLVGAYEWNGADWRTLTLNWPRGPNAEPPVNRLNLVHDAAGRPVMAWETETEASHRGQVFARRWNGLEWEWMSSGDEPDAGVSRADIGHWPKLAAAEDGRVSLVYHRIPDAHLTLDWSEEKRVWTPIDSASQIHGGVSSGRGVITSNVDLAIHPETQSPWIAWADNSLGHYTVQVRQWDGAEWLRVGNDVFPGTDPQLSFDSLGRPILVWESSFRTLDGGALGNTEIHLRRWSGSSWEGVGDDSASSADISTASGFNRSPVLVVDSSDRITVAWLQRFPWSGLSSVQARRWDGESWRGLDGTVDADILGTADAVSHIDLTLDSQDNPVVAWSRRASRGDVMMTRHWNGESWGNPYSAPDLSDRASWLHFRMDPSTDSPRAAFGDLLMGGLFDYNGGQWERDTLDFILPWWGPIGDMECQSNGIVWISAWEVLQWRWKYELNLYARENGIWRRHGDGPRRDPVFRSLGQMDAPQFDFTDHGGIVVTWVHQNNSIFLLTSGPMLDFGDLDFDGVPTAADVVLLINGLQSGEWPHPIAEQNADVNRDGSLSEADLEALIARILAR